MAKKIAEKAVESASSPKQVEIKHLQTMKDEAGKDVSVVDWVEVKDVDGAISDAEAQLASAEAKVTELKADIAEYKKTIRQELDSYRSNQPEQYQLHTRSSLYKDEPSIQNIDFYSFIEAENKPEIGEHEYKRLKISWSSLRKHNQDIEIRFCYHPDLSYTRFKREAEQEKWQSLCDDFGVEMYPFHESFTGQEPNAWCIHRWYNLTLWKNENLNILYLDADTYINDDIQLIFDHYKRDPIYGREELGFRHDPNQGIHGEDPRFYLDLIDASILSQGGIREVQKYCLGVILLNHSIHKLFTPEVHSDYKDLL